MNLHVNHLHLILQGVRPIPLDKLDAVVKFLSDPSEKPENVRDTLARLMEPGVTRLSLLDPTAETTITVGFIATPPFVKTRAPGDNHPDGLLVDLIKLLFPLFGAKISWRPIGFHEMLERLADGEVDCVTGFILDTVRRKTRARFIPLSMPFSTGINAVTKAADIPGNSSYPDGLALLQRLTKPRKKGNPLSIVVIDGELAHDYLAAIAPDTSARYVVKDERTIQEVIADYATSDQSDQYVIFADSFSCQKAAADNGSLKQVFKDPIGRFAGGFLLPLDDEPWAEFFQQAILHLLSARLPETGRIFAHHANDLQVFLDERELPAWRARYWPPEIDFPESWKITDEEGDEAEEPVSWFASLSPEQQRLVHDLGRIALGRVERSFDDDK